MITTIILKIFLLLFSFILVRKKLTQESSSFGTVINVAGIENCSLCFLNFLSKVKDLLRISMI